LASAVAGYEETRKRHVEYMFGRLGEHLARLSWSAEQLREERTARLRELIAVAKARSAWHAARLGHIDPRTIDEDGLSELPVMTKADLMSHFDSVVTDPRVSLDAVNAHIAGLGRDDAYFLDELHAVASGGSSGVRGVFVWGWEAYATAWLMYLRRMVDDRMRDPVLSSRPAVVMAVGADNAAHFTSALPQTFATELAQIHRYPITLPLQTIVEGLNSVDGDTLATYPSMLSMLVAEARAGRLTIAPRRVVTMAEPLLPEIRDAAQQTWDAPVANLWGISEGGTAALGCFRDAGMHLADDLVIVEPVDEHGDPVPPGVRSDRVYVTNLFNLVMPLIRYEITDPVTPIDGACACGSAHRRIADIEGGRDAVFEYPDGLTVHPHVFRSVLTHEAAITEYQVRQTSGGAEILLCAHERVDEQRIARKLEDALRHLGCQQAEITVKLAERLPRLQSGKLQRFIPLPTRPRPATNNRR
jgi:phenylacetate-CoA ligase